MSTQTVHDLLMSGKFPVNAMDMPLESMVLRPTNTCSGQKRRHSCAGGARVAKRVAERERISTRRARAAMQRVEAVTNVIVKNALVLGS